MMLRVSFVHVSLVLVVVPARAFLVSPPRVLQLAKTQTTTLSFASDKDKNRNVFIPWLDDDERPNAVSTSSSSSTKSVEDLLSKVFNPSSLSDNADSILQNMLDGEFGKRGEVYVALQFSLIFCIAFGGIPLVGNAIIHDVLGPALVLAGLAACFFAIQALGPYLSPWPVSTATSRADNNKHELITTGLLFGQVRHPIYAGLLAACVGGSIVTDSVTRLFLTAVLLYVLDLKTDYEEQDLMAQYPGEYAAYKATVTSKFVPRALIRVLPWTKKQEADD